MDIRVDITIGTGKTHDGRSILPEQRTAFIDDALATLAETFGGVTLAEGRGAWKDDATGSIVVESSATFTVYLSDAPASVYRDAIKRVAVDLGRKLDQAQVVVAWSDAPDTAFVSTGVRSLSLAD
jgi:hypothetical protein